jgi:uncharacterized damage-inducible protein DinB
LLARLAVLDSNHRLLYDRAMPSCAEPFITRSMSLLSDEYLNKLTRSLSAVTDADVWWRPNEASNSIGNLLLHLRGNVTQWILGGVGQRPFERTRPEEFSSRGGATAQELLHDLSTTVHQACEVIARQTGDSLLERRQIQGYDVSVLEAVYHVVEHFSMHTGQIILLAKARSGSDLALWQPPPPSSRT